MHMMNYKAIYIASASYLSLYICEYQYNSYLGS